MRMLALETSQMAGSVAALDDDRLLVERELAAGQRSAQSLAPAMRDVLTEVGWRPADVELVAVATGPGSFTGLRVGVTTAKVFAYATQSHVIGVNTLEVIAARVPVEVRRFAVVLDAQRRQVFAASFVRDDDGKLTCEESTRLVDDDAWIAGVAAGMTVTGPGLEKLAARLPAGVQMIEPAKWSPTAAAVGQVANRSFLAGHRDKVFDLVPHYFRRTAAEEQWDGRQGL
jgi:tRNA threonylcarbamoyladenosine biosynthesis protein TsaB